jgi:lauroyl/myristoyl acyltransferase
MNESTSAAGPRRWTLHGLNNGVIFSATRRGVGILPRVVSYGIGHVGTWIAWRTMATSRAAIADNLSALFPGESRRALEGRALEMFRSYACDVIDFLRAVGVRTARRPRSSTSRIATSASSSRLRARPRDHPRQRSLRQLGGRGRPVPDAQVPLSVVAMTEADPKVNQIRREIRDQIGAKTIETRQSLDTALQIRRELGANKVVAMLIDRHYGRDRVGVTLFGRRAWFLRLPFVMGHATGAPILPCTVERNSPGRFDICPSAPVYVATDIPRDEAIATAAQKIAEAVEERIRVRARSSVHVLRGHWDAQRRAMTA